MQDFLKYVVARIDEDDYGCEERSEGTEREVIVTLVHDEDVRCIKYKDSELYEKDIDEGDTVTYVDKILSKVKK